MNYYKLERKFGKYAVPNLSLIIIAAYVLGYILQMVAGNAMELLMLEPYMILHGQVWRLVSWILIPPSSLSIFTLINLFFFYSLGRTLERIWGDFRYNLYIFTGIISVIVGAFVLYAFGHFTGLMGYAQEGPRMFCLYIGYFVSTYYINIAVIMAFALTIPDMTILFWFVIPLKIKWLAYLEAFTLGLDFYNFRAYPYPSIPRAVMIISLLNFFIFYFSSRNISVKSFTGGAKRKSFTSGTAKKGFTVYRKSSEGNRRADSEVTRHKCAICGRTEVSNPELSFRFCSKCNGNYEYCDDHLYTHTHIE